ncbi:MAG: PAS domain-containing sensor histidine kinase [Steroidobacteraceae bacterium]|jgi:PAS domain S-box-containing protein
MNDRFDTVTTQPDDASSALEAPPGAFQAVSRELDAIVGAAVEPHSMRNAEQLLRTQAVVLNTMSEGIALVDPDGRIEFTNPAFDRMFRGKPREFSEVINALHSSPYGRLPRRVAAAARGRSAGAGQKREILFSRSDGSHFACEVSFLSLGPTGGDKTLAVVQDLTERKKLEAEILEVAGNERWRLSADLHDGLGQELTGISLLLRGLAERTNSAPAKVPSELEEIIAQVNRTIQSVRDLARGISPVTVRHGDLVSALKWLTAWFQDSHGVDVRLHLMIHRPLLMNESAATHLYLIAQEAINNAIKHGRARSVVVKLRTSTNLAYLSVADDGVGLSDNSSRGAGLGLKLMEYRAAMIGGRMHIKRPRNAGTRLRIVCPRTSAE